MTPPTNYSLYLVTVIIFRPDPLLTRYVDKATGKLCLFYDGDPDVLSCIDFWPEVGAYAQLIVAASEDEAMETLLRKVGDCLPEEEGWLYQKGRSLRVDYLDILLGEIDRCNRRVEGESCEDGELVM